MSLGFRVPGTGDRNIDAVLWGVRWKATELTYSFPEDVDGYSGEEPNIDLAEFQPVTADLADAIRFILETQFPAVAQLTFREVAPGSDSMLTFGTLTSEETAHANIPRFSPDSYAGDIWFNQQQFNLAPIGSYAYFTAMHEIGHSLGLKHGHDGGSPVEYGVSTLPLTADRDSVEFSIMTYRPYTAANFEYYTIPDGSYPQTPMMYDIAALQYLYGANYETNAGDTVYRFDRDTGEMSVNGVGQGAPSANVILRTIWDGGGNDTYDFSNYEADLRIDLSPGGWTVLGTEQRATMGQMEVAQAHLYNALLYQDDPRSLIENAIGGSGDDTIFGNGADNRLEGGLGTNILDGRGGFDTAVIAAALTDITYSFEGRYLAFERPDEKGDLAIRIEAFAFSDGTVIRDDGFALLDDLYYYTQNHDIWLAGADAESHYAASGWREGRDPNAFFSTAVYLAMNPDVAAAGIDPLQHYREFGWKELRDPSAAFDTGAYLARYTDVAAAGINPLEHYLAYGQAEGRLPLPVVGELNVIGFDASYYLLSNLDVLQAGLSAWGHYSTQGWREGRDPNAYFDTSLYLESNPDVAAAGMDPLQHYHESGWREGRTPSERFDGAAYLAAYADIAEGQYDPLLHFLKYGDRKSVV